MPTDNLTRDEARARARLLSDVAYDVAMDVRSAGETFASRAVVRFRCAEPGAGTFIDLDAATVESVTLNDRALAADAFTGHRITLDDLAEHNELVVVARCRYQRTGVGLHRFTDPVDGHVYLHTQFEPFDAHRVYPCFDQPDLKAPFTLTVDAPAGWECVSNAEVTERPAEGDAGTWRFAPTLPISTYITALVAGPYHAVHDHHRITSEGGEVQDVPLGVYCRRSLAAHLDTAEILEVTRQGFDFFTAAFGYPYPFGKYDQLFVPEFNFGAMENAGCVTFSESFIFRSKVTDAARQSRASTILHEMAHMWFGDLVTMRWWDDLWLNESFATYMGTLALAEATRFTTAWAHFASSTKAWAVSQDQLPTTHPIAADIVDTDAVRTHFDGITYAKGASVLKQLVAWVSREAFLAGLRDYFRRHGFGNAELVDFLGALEAASGRDLGDWSKQWLQTAGVTTLRADTITAPDAASGVRRYEAVTIRQEATEAYPTLRDHRVAVGCYALGDGALARSGRAELDVTGSATDVDQLAGEPVPDLLLVNDDDLAFAKVRLDDASVQTLQTSLSLLADPLARALCWGALWDMTRDAELPTRRFVALVAGHVAAEDEVGMLQSILGQAQTATLRYGDPANRDAAKRLLADAARGGLEWAEGGGDRQLVWVRCIAGLAASPQDRAWTRALLDGTVTVPGLAVDTELRWHLVTSLAAAGTADEELIAAEAERDPTDMGARRAATARAARPTAEAKAAAWEALTQDRSLPLAMMRALVGGFSRYGQDEVLAPYIEPYVDLLPAVWAERTPDEALLLSDGLYPSGVVSEDVVAAADRALALDGLPAPGARLVAEGRDGTLRALRARAADRA
ncbi:MAG TPA: aminopeptidase N [Egibacteraceae bacterium]|nr:aminopeptidase N [Egibacteraceae bacterium]